MVHGKAVRHAGAAIVSGHEEALMPEAPHRLHLVLRHRPKRIIDVPLAPIGLAGIAISAQVGDDNGVIAGELRRDSVPAHMGLRMPVQ
jgi:hypothetical protein